MPFHATITMLNPMSQPHLAAAAQQLVVDGHSRHPLAHAAALQRTREAQQADQVCKGSEWQEVGLSCNSNAASDELVMYLGCTTT